MDIIVSHSMPLSTISTLSCLDSTDDAASFDSDEWAPIDPSRPISHLLAKDSCHVPLRDYPSRAAAVDWILRVSRFHRFRPVTAYLSVSYLDRFLSSHALILPEGDETGWPVQLASVACVSVASKLEETHVPLLFELQILAPRFVFDRNNIQRMELLLMSALRWEMRLLTPFDFLEHFAESFAPELLGQSRAALFSRATDFLVRTTRVVEFLAYRPSVIAAAAVIRSVGEIANLSAGDIGEWVSMEVVKECVQLMQDRLTTDTCPSPEPQSLIGVLDAATCDSQKSSAPDATNSEPSRLEPPNKLSAENEHNL